MYIKTQGSQENMTFSLGTKDIFQAMLCYLKSN